MDLNTKYELNISRKIEKKNSVLFSQADFIIKFKATLYQSTFVFMPETPTIDITKEDFWREKKMHIVRTYCNFQRKSEAWSNRVLLHSLPLRRHYNTAVSTPSQALAVRNHAGGPESKVRQGFKFQEEYQWRLRLRTFFQARLKKKKT